MSNMVKCKQTTAIPIENANSFDNRKVFSEKNIKGRYAVIRFDKLEQYILLSKLRRQNSKGDGKTKRT